MIYFISDNHFGHDNIRKYANRPFSSVEEMDEHMIAVWNETVGSDDIVYHLGDFCLGDFDMAKSYIRRLNGRIRFVTPDFHHDKRWINEIKARQIKSRTVQKIEILPPIYALELEDRKCIILSHHPQFVWDRQHYLSYHLYGHIHQKSFRIPYGPLSLNVCVDAIPTGKTFGKPISIDEVNIFMLDQIMHYDPKPIGE